MKTNTWPMAVVGVAALAATFLFQPQPAMTQGQYLGVQSCSTSACHQKSTKPGAPAAFPSWSKDPHSVSFAGGPTSLGAKSGLKGAKAAEIAKKMGIKDPSSDDKCLKCHAGGVQGGVSSKMGLPPKGNASLEDGVQCESCHGPGAKFKDIHQKDHKAALANGMVDLLAPQAAGKQCLACHSKSTIGPEYMKAGHPDQDKFNFGAYADKIKHWGGTMSSDGTYQPKK